MPRPGRLLTLVTAWAAAALAAAAAPADPAARARARGQGFEEAVRASDRLLRAWLRHADPRTLLLPDRPAPERGPVVYTPHNSGADLYPYLILTAELTAPDLYRGRMLEMLRNEVRYTSALDGIPGDLELGTGRLGRASFFGAGEYAKDGLVSVTEYLGRSPWFARMADMIADAMTHAPVESRFGRLPAADAELNGDYLQALVRLATMTGDPRYLEWARRIGDAYVDEVLPGTHGLPSYKWDFARHAGETRLRLRDHGNESVVGLVMLFALEHDLRSPRAERYRPVLARMLDRILESANPDGMLYNEIDVATLEPLDERLSDNWGYVYGAVYAFYQVTGDTKYRDAVRRVLGNLPKYRNWTWEPRAGTQLGSFDGYADAIESAIYLVNREPVAEAEAWIDSEIRVMWGMQRPDGHVEDWYGEGNFNRTSLLYAYMQSQGVRPAEWTPGIRVGAVREGDGLRLSLEAPGPIVVRFDYARHRRVLNFQKNYVRLNEFPEWFTVEENRLYDVRAQGATAGGEHVRLGSELVAGIRLAPGDYVVTPVAAAARP